MSQCGGTTTNRSKIACEVARYIIKKGLNHYDLVLFVFIYLSCFGQKPPAERHKINHIIINLNIYIMILSSLVFFGIWISLLFIVANAIDNRKK